MSAVATSPVGSRVRHVRDAVADAARVWEKAWASSRLLHKEGERHPLQRWLAPLRTRSAALFGVFGVIALLASTTTVIDVQDSPAFITRGHFPLLVMGLFVTSVVARRSGPTARRAVFLVASLGAAAFFSLVFAVSSLLYFSVLYLVLVSRAPAAIKIAFAVVSVFGAAAACDTRLFPHLTAAHPSFYVFGCMVAQAYVLRMLSLLHELTVHKPAARPRYVDVVLYFMFAPSFVIVPGMWCIPRFTRFSASLDEPAKDADLAAVRYAIAGLSMALFVAALRHVAGDPRAAYQSALGAHHGLMALAAGVLVDPVYRVLEVSCKAYLIMALTLATGIGVGPNLNGALASESILDWWRRWNVHFRDLLVDVFYYPVALRVRNPYLGLVLGCVSVFVVGSTALHWVLQMFAHGSITAISWPTLGESIASCVVVATALCLERKRLARKGRKKPRPAPLSDPQTPVVAWAGAKGARVLRIAGAYLLIFLTTRMAQDATRHVVARSERDASTRSSANAQGAARPSARDAHDEPGPSLER